MQSNVRVISKDQLIQWFLQGAKSKNDWKVGTEHEKFAYNLSGNNNSFCPIQYDSKNGIKEFLKEITKYGWKPVLENDNIISLKKDNQSITLEPGGQIELSGAPLKDIHSACKETNQHLKLVKKVGNKLKITLVGLGLRPLEKTSSVPWMPKARYKIMKNYMPKKGSKGLDMMLSTCTVQANLDYSDEQDMISKTILAVKIQPIITALFANSPFSEGSPNGFLSKRRYIWMNTDPDRCGILKIVFDEDFSFLKYVDYALSVPMYFVIRNGQYIDCAGKSFIDFMNGQLEQLPGEMPTIKDWEDHLSTIFTEVRLKRFIEVRGADAGNWRITCALPAFWVGILYDLDVLKKALFLCKDWSYIDIENLSFEAAKHGLKAKIKGFSVKEVATELISLAKIGLQKRAKYDTQGNDETQYLKVLEEIIETGRTPAEQLLEKYNSDWNKQIKNLIKEMAY